MNLLWGRIMTSRQVLLKAEALLEYWLSGAPWLSALLSQWATSKDKEARQTWYVSSDFPYWMQYPDTTLTHAIYVLEWITIPNPSQASGCTRILCERRLPGRWLRLGLMSPGRFTTSFLHRFFGKTLSSLGIGQGVQKMRSQLKILRFLTIE